MKIVFLYNFHYGIKSPLPSDTLWGNLCWAMYYLYGENTLIEFLNAYSYQPPLILSSTFPYYKEFNQKEKLFFPRPSLPLKSFESIQSQNQKLNKLEKIQQLATRKEQKNIEFVEYDFFQNLILGKENTENLPKSLVPILKPSSLTRNTINRIQGGTLEIKETGQLFTQEFYYLQLNKENISEIGLFFVCKDNTEGKLEACLRLLSHWGIGGNRTIGKGYFEFRIENFEIQEPQNPNALLNLSLYHPNHEEITYYKTQPELFVYQLVMRKGYFGEKIGNKYEKLPLFFFKEGSLFPLLEKEFYGKNVQELGKVHRYGMPLMLKIFVNNLNH